MIRFTPENIIANLDRYTELVRLRERHDHLTFTGTPHDIAKYVCVVYELPELEDALLAAGLFRWSTGEIISWAGRKV